MSYNDFPEQFRKNLREEHLGVENDLEYAAGILLQAADRDDSYGNKGLAKPLQEIVENTDVEIIIDGDEVRFE